MPSTAVRAVLGDVHWLREIARFQSGLPGLIRRFQAQENAPEKIISRTELATAAIQAEDLPVLAMLDRLASEPQYEKEIQFDQALETAARHGRRTALQWLLARHRRRGMAESTLQLLDAVVGGCGDVETAHWILVQCPASCQHISVDAVATAASRGHLAILQWLHDTRRCEAAFQPTTMDRAAAYGHMEIVQFLHDHRQEGCTLQAPIQAAVNGRLAVLTLLFQWYPHQFRSHPEILDAATSSTTGSSDHLAMVQFLHEKVHTASGASGTSGSRDRFAIVQFLHESVHAPCTLFAVDNAAANGETEIVAYLLARRTEGFSARALTAAARAGHVEIVRLLLQYLATYPHMINGTTTIFSSALTAASQPGHTEIVRLLLDASAATGTSDAKPNVAAAIRIAAAWGRLEIVKLLLAKGEWISLLDAITQASYQDHHEIVDLLNQAMRDRQGKRE